MQSCAWLTILLETLPNRNSSLRESPCLPRTMVLHLILFLSSIVVVKKRSGIETFFDNRTFAYAALPHLGVFKPGAKHPFTPTPIKALACLCFFPPLAGKSKPPASRVPVGPEHYSEKRYKHDIKIVLP